MDTYTKKEQTIYLLGMLDKLEYKISRYRVAVKTGKFTWD